MDEIPAFARSELFPFEGDMRLKDPADLVIPEPPRSGEEAKDCRACATPDERFVWVNERWRLSVIEGLAVPLAVSLSPRGHYDSPDLPDDLASEVGTLLIRIERAVLATGGVGRVHFAKWGDGGAHLHWWVMARQEGALQQRGSYLVLWAQSFPPPPAAEVAARAAAVAEELARHGGRRPQPA